MLIVAGAIICCLLTVASSFAAQPAKPKPTIELVGEPLAGSMLRFRLTGRARPGTTVVRYRLDFGDGTKPRRGKGQPAQARHVYRVPGIYLLKLTAVDADGHTARTRLRLRVRAVSIVLPSPRPEPVSGPRIQTVPIGPPAPPVPPGGTGRVEVWSAPVELAPGSTEPVVLGSWIQITEVDSLYPGAPPGLSAALEGDSIVLQAAAAASPGSSMLTVAGEGCIEENCDLPLDVNVPLTVRDLEAPSEWLFDFTSPSPDRIAAGTPVGDDGTTLVDELLITLGSEEEPGFRTEADAVATSVEAVVSGGVEALGVYEIRWEVPQDLEARRAQLLADPAVSAVSDSNVGLVYTDREPSGDWSDDTSQATWPFEQIHAQQAWDVTQGSDVTVGIVDGGLAYSDHEDLNVVSTFAGSSAFHATHVAGLACARENGIGLVGVAWGCPIATAGVRSASDKDVLLAAVEIALQSGARVVNMSLGYNYRGTDTDRCATAAQEQEKLDAAANFKPAFRRMFSGPVGRAIVWTISAGNNCAVGVPSPWGANSDLENVITVAATNSDQKLASFSNFGQGVEVAAPGGVGVGNSGDGTVGLWSTGYEPRCGLFEWFECGSYTTEYGTSMAAPVVAGIAALVRSAHPGYGAVETAECITETAGEETGIVTEASPLPKDGHVRHVTYSPTTLPIVDAAAAVECDTFGPVDDADYIGRWSGGFLLDVFEEADGVLGAINQRETSYENSVCVDPPGTQIFSQMAKEPNGQWSGNTVTIGSTCTTHSWRRIGALRIVRGSDGAPTLVAAWTRQSGSTPPTIAADGTITSSFAYNEARMRRVEGDQVTSTTSREALPAVRQERARETSSGQALAPVGVTVHPPSSE